MNYSKMDTYIDIECIKYINSMIESKNLDQLKVANFIKSKALANKNNPSAYLRSIFIREMEKGSFNKVEEKINFGAIISQLRSAGIAVSNEESCYLEVFFNYLIREQLLESSNLRSLCNKCIYCTIANKEQPTAQDFIESIKSSKALKNKSVDYTAIKKEWEEEKEEWKEIISTI